jgi:hypothetical protein
LAIVTERWDGMRWTRERWARRWWQGGINSVSDRAACRRTALKRTAKSCGSDASVVGVKSFGGAKAQLGRSASFREATEARKPDTPG